MPVLEAWRGLNSAVKASMDPRRYEIATVAAALRLRSSYCSLAHGKVPEDETLRHIGAKYGKSAVQVAMRWLLDQPDERCWPAKLAADRLFRARRRTRGRR